MANGCNQNALGPCSTAEGKNTTANGEASHAEGYNTTASGTGSHAEGFFSSASGNAAHAEGEISTASGEAAHTEGHLTKASGNAAHTEGFRTRADAPFSHTEGASTSANGLMGVHVIGINGAPRPEDPPFSWYLVNGPEPFSTAGVVAKILNNGNACFDGIVTASSLNPAAGACDFAEMFESSSGEPIDVGYFVTFDGASEKIRKANASDDYILGIVSSNPGVLTDTEDPACSKFLLDEWNRKQFEDISLPAITDHEGTIILPERTERQPVLNPFWEPTKPCRSRAERPEWAAVGLIGKLLVRDDGTCVVGGYCIPNNDGIAKNAETGYRVMKRTGDNQILVLFR